MIHPRVLAFVVIIAVLNPGGGFAARFYQRI
jgi:hypothetical protein